MRQHSRSFIILFAAVMLFPAASLSEPGITDNEIVFGSILPLTGRAEGLGKGMKVGLLRSLAGESVGPRGIRLLFLDDLYEPSLTSLKVRKLNRKGIFAMIGNVGTPTASVSLPMLEGLDTLLAAAKPMELVPQTGAGALVNGKGPVGVYIRNTREVAPGYQSLKNWEQKTGNRCKLVVTVGAYDNIARFVKEARDALGKDFGFVSLEGYIVGKLTLKLLEDTTAPLTREGFVEQSRRARFDLSGLDIDFTNNGYQGSDLVVVSHLTDGGYRNTGSEAWSRMLDWHPDSDGPER